MCRLHKFLLVACLSDAAGLPVHGPWWERPGGQRSRESAAAGVSAAGRGPAPPGEESSPEDQGAHGRRRNRRERGRGRVWRDSPILPPRQTHKSAQHGCAVRRRVQPLQRLPVLLQLWAYTHLEHFDLFSALVIYESTHEELKINISVEAFHRIPNKLLFVQKHNALNYSMQKWSILSILQRWPESVHSPRVPLVSASRWMNNLWQKITPSLLPSAERQWWTN